MLLDRTPVKRVVGIARRLRDQNGPAIARGLQALSLDSQFVDVEDVGARVVDGARRVRLVLVAQDGELFVGALC